MFQQPTTSRFASLLAAKDGPRYVIQNQEVDSDNEYYVALALHKNRLPFIYQYDVLFGRSRLGGFVIDFLVLTEPLSTPLFVNGDYWHRDRGREFKQLASLPATVRDELAPPVFLWGDETSTEELALAAVRKAFG
jgi:hypothetical protein